MKTVLDFIDLYSNNKINIDFCSGLSKTLSVTKNISGKWVFNLILKYFSDIIYWSIEYFQNTLILPTCQQTTPDQGKIKAWEKRVTAGIENK